MIIYNFIGEILVESFVLEWFILWWKLNCMGYCYSKDDLILEEVV